MTILEGKGAMCKREVAACVGSRVLVGFPAQALAQASYNGSTCTELLGNEEQWVEFGVAM